MSIDPLRARLLESREDGAAGPPHRPGCGGILLYLAATLWALGCSVLAQAGLWYIGQLLRMLGQEPPAYAWMLVTFGLGLVLIAPLLLLGGVTRIPHYRIVFRTWVIAAGFSLLLSLVRLFPELWKQPVALAQIILCLNGAAVLALLTRRPPGREARDRGPLALAFTLGALIGLPWLAFGALGSPLDTLLNLAAGLSLGLFAGLLLSRTLFEPLADSPRLKRLGGRLPGSAAAVTLAILAAGFGFAGSLLPLVIALPAAGLLSAGIARRAGVKNSTAPLTVVLGFSAGWPLMFFDPNEITLYLSDGDIYTWALIAAGAAAAIALLAGLLLSLTGRTQRESLPPAPAALIAGVTWIVALQVYFFAGQPGFYGDRLLVILNGEADPSPAAVIGERNERVRYVYNVLSRYALLSQTSLRRDLDEVGLAYTPYYLVNAVEVQADFPWLFMLERRPDVDRVLFSPRLRPLPASLPSLPDELPPPAAPPWNIAAIGADRVWQELGITGAGIIVGHSDSGVQGDHPALESSYRGRGDGDDFNWLDPWSGTTAPADRSGHGTHTLGTILGSGGIGVAPGAGWMACVNLERNLGNPALYLDCLQFMLAPYPQGGDPFTDGRPAQAAHVLNNSWGCPPFEGCDTDVLRPAVQALRHAGIFVVVSAGNEGPLCGTISDPLAIFQEAFTVGAFDEDGAIASFSSRGPVYIDDSGRLKPDIVAPGVGILSATPDGGYAEYDGTSMAGPHVAGVVALMWSANPALIGNIAATEELLRSTAWPYDGPRDLGCFGEGNPKYAAGYGLLDAYAAVFAALEWGK